MSDQPLDLRRSLHLLWRRKFVVAIFVALGLAAGIGLTMLRPIMLTSNALVVLPQTVHNVATQVVIASSDPVLTGAQRRLGLDGPPQTLRNIIKVKTVTSDIISISAQGKTAAQAERAADAVADSYVAYVNSPSRPGPPVQARILQPALNATATPLPERMLVTGGLGVLLGLLIGSIVVLATGRRDRRLKERDEIADSIGIPVLASPYHGTVVENHITFGQNNHFASNTYNGPWQFIVHQQGNVVSWATWQGRPYDQDAGSTMNRHAA